MTRRVSWGIYGLLLLCTAAAWLVTDSAAAFAAAVLILLLPALSPVWNLLARRRLTVRLSVQTFSEKNEPIKGTLHMRCGAFFVPCGRVTAFLSVQNALTGTHETLPLTLLPDGRRYQAAFRLSSAHCGQLRLSVETLRLWDVFSVLSVPVRTPSSARCTVLPLTFPVEIADPALTGMSGEADDYLPIGGGTDFTEVYQLRDYAPGDSVRGMHWLLSAKRDALIYRDPARSVQRSLLLFWDQAPSAPDVADALAEAFFSVSQALCEAGLPFTLAFAQDDVLRTEHVTDPDRLASVLPLLLGGGKGAAQPDPAQFGRTLWFTPAAELPPEPSVLGIVCTADGADLPNAIVFTPQTVWETLHRLDWNHEG